MMLKSLRIGKKDQPIVSIKAAKSENKNLQIYKLLSATIGLKTYAKYILSKEFIKIIKVYSLEIANLYLLH